MSGLPSFRPGAIGSGTVNHGPWSDTGLGYMGSASNALPLEDMGQTCSWNQFIYVEFWYVLFGVCQHVRSTDKVLWWLWAYSQDEHRPIFHQSFDTWPMIFVFTPNMSYLICINIYIYTTHLLRYKWVFSIKGGTPKWMACDGRPIYIDDLGAPPFQETPIYFERRFRTAKERFCKSFGVHCRVWPPQYPLLLNARVTPWGGAFL